MFGDLREGGEVEGRKPKDGLEKVGGERAVVEELLDGFGGEIDGFDGF